MVTLNDVVRGGITAVFLLILLAMGSLLTHNSVNAAAPAKSSAPGRGYYPGRSYYLTPETVAGDAALTACAAGYHMANIGELDGLSNLRYETTLGLTRDDSGFGPPLSTGWIRTGNGASVAMQFFPNCNVWTSGNVSDYGTAAIAFDGTGGLHSAGLVYSQGTCEGQRGVFCVED